MSMYNLGPWKKRHEELMKDPDAANLKMEIKMLEEMEATLAASTLPDAPKKVATTRKRLAELRKTQEALETK